MANASQSIDGWTWHRKIQCQTRSPFHATKRTAIIKHEMKTGQLDDSTSYHWNPHSSCFKKTCWVSCGCQTEAREFIPWPWWQLPPFPNARLPTVERPETKKRQPWLLTPLTSYKKRKNTVASVNWVDCLPRTIIQRILTRQTTICRAARAIGCRQRKDLHQTWGCTNCRPWNTWHFQTDLQ